MLATEIIVREFAEGVIAGIKDNIKSKPVTEYGAVGTSGQAVDSLFYRYDGNHLIIGSTWGYITVLEDGRKPGKGVSREGQLKLQKWILEKPLQVKENSSPIPGIASAKSLAYLISRKLKEEGSLLYQKGGHSGILSDYINADYVAENFTKKFAEALVIEVSEIFRNVSVAA